MPDDSEEPTPVPTPSSALHSAPSTRQAPPPTAVSEDDSSSSSDSESSRGDSEQERQQRLAELQEQVRAFKLKRKVELWLIGLTQRGNAQEMLLSPLLCVFVTFSLKLSMSNWQHSPSHRPASPKRKKGTKRRRRKRNTRRRREQKNLQIPPLLQCFKLLRKAKAAKILLWQRKKRRKLGKKISGKEKKNYNSFVAAWTGAKLIICPSQEERRK